MKSLLISILLLCTFSGFAQGPKVLIVTAHPDDETMFPVTVFKITRELKGNADLALITDASGGFNGMLASMYYGMNMLDSVVGRKNLPLIRKKEMMAAGEILGIGNYYFFDQIDDYYNRNEKPYLQGKNWDISYIERRLDGILAKGQYDYIFCMVPHEGQHAHHKAASLSALRAVQRYKGPKPPIVLGGQSANKGYTFTFTSLDGYPESTISPAAPVFEFDRSFGFGEDNKHSYMIVADWVKASHKSQSGDMNQSMHRGELETFWYFALNGDQRITEVKQLFETLKKSGFPTK
ncbi:PIG-L family deacetylase [Runella rosea]|uniref:PIG-L family deacetylase n=1 Tax=Runella rosea TaxID=2259595 RepID=A0A344TFT2_9BACT|nr:PIG-L family deacetylase [Runella rosea]AXE17503.1 PIG-L family deacetylase [Runella rosea]